LWSWDYVAELQNGLTGGLRLIAASSPEEKSAALGFLSQLVLAHDAQL
jgi:hypothetical protein